MFIPLGSGKNGWIESNLFKESAPLITNRELPKELPHCPRCVDILSGITHDPFRHGLPTRPGMPIVEVLQLARLKPQARLVSLISTDGFKVDIDLETAMNPENFLAYEWEDQPIPVLHGFPLRAVIPSTAGGNWVKWLVEINVK